MILATREYIFNQAKEVYEAFKLNNIEIAKCVIDLSTYTNIIKAKILYNHLFHGEIPEIYIDNLLESKNYKNLISHPNYSPRIIETFIKQNIWNNCNPDDFYKAIKTLFDNPQSVWLYSFENSLDKFSQYVLFILSTLGTPILLNDLESAVQEFFRKNSYKLLINFDSIKFSKSIRELENSFIRTNADRNGKIIVEYQNPSVYDFLINYLSDKTFLISNLIEAFVFVDQFYRIFSGYKSRGKIQLNKQLIEKLSIRLLELESNIVSCRIKNVNKGNGIEFNIDNDFLYRFLNYLNGHYANQNTDINEFVYKNLSPIIEFKFSSYRTDYLDLLESVDLSRFDFNEEKLIDSFFCYSDWIDDLELFERVKDIFPKLYTEWITSNHFKGIATQIINKELDQITGEEASDYKTRVTSLRDIYQLDLVTQLEKLERIEIEYDEYIEHQIDMYTEGEIGDYGEKDISEDVVITEIFNSLKG